MEQERIIKDRPSMSALREAGQFVVGLMVSLATLALMNALLVAWVLTLVRDAMGRR